VAARAFLILPGDNDEHTSPLVLEALSICARFVFLDQRWRLEALLVMAALGCGPVYLRG
jgi:hypothetical protein